MIGREQRMLRLQYRDGRGSFPTLAFSAVVDSHGGLGRSAGGDCSPSGPLRFPVGCIAAGSL